ncbi:prolyl oligopeptidase family protein [uncultured Cellulomonas sp.]|uniref:prolyl oligopeptidase family serine peptidase n=1 Tax=uncultured Cellulomonas sp. TaxID=189682 RepID=UPI0026328F16|nr:prolyl oligopeptidase family serine peptidase [uncultured Cellulomonas sp.]
MDTDPYAWLEDVEGADALAWVRERNADALDRLAESPGFTDIRREVLEVLDSDAKIPMVGRAGEHLYNFWRDAEHERGVWRRTTLDQYRTDDPAWETLLDLDALSAAEGESWVWHGAQVLRPDLRRALVSLSRGGSDADVTRELDLQTLEWVADGFVREEAKGGLGWVDRDTVFAYTDVGPGTMTTSGYPRTVRRWTRGTALADAPVVFEGRPDDLYISAHHDRTPGFERDLVVRAIAFYRQQVFLLGADDALTLIDVPQSAEVSLQREWLLVEPREDWSVGGRSYPAGSLLAARLDDYLAGSRDLEVLFTPTATTSLAGLTWTRSHLVLTLLDDVRHRLQVLTPGEAGWATSDLPGVPELTTVSVAGVDPDESDDLWMTTTGYLTPTTLSLVTVGGAAEALKSTPTFFDGSGHTVSQHMATSDDGTRVPYFLVRPDGLPDGGPTLLYGYGGFEVSLTPSYSGALGRGWLARGGVYAVANIRGGGEYGPRWHQLALRENRHRAYEDFAAVARDLVDRGVTTPQRLGVQGGSNGGLLTGNMLVRYPELIGAAVVQVPLLDMRRYSHLLAGASWMAEYGDPDDPDDWAFLRTFSPYHLLDADRAYPPVLLTTSTRDDRVHPGHARKMTARLLELGKDVTYFENIEGGHGGAATNAQAAHMTALAYTFLWQRLAGGVPDGRAPGGLAVAGRPAAGHAADGRPVDGPAAP